VQRKQKSPLAGRFLFSGAPGRIRTPDLLIRSGFGKGHRFLLSFLLVCFVSKIGHPEKCVFLLITPCSLLSTAQKVHSEEEACFPGKGESGGKL
jgi:hypothetical protein